MPDPEFMKKARLPSRNTYSIRRSRYMGKKEARNSEVHAAYLTKLYIYSNL